MNRTLVAGLGSTLVLLFLTIVFAPPLDKMEEQLIDARYKLRGEVAADTNIVLLYFDNDDIAALGGWPLRRNYYALLINVLNQAGASVVGVNIFFGEHNLEFPEYDALLATAAARCGNVVFSSYYRALTDSPPSRSRVLVPTQFAVPPTSTGLYGENLQLPFPELLIGAAGIGITNLINGSSGKLPLFVRDSSGTLLSFSVELLRLYENISRHDVRFDNQSIHFASGGPVRSIDFQGQGIVTLNYPGSLHSFRTFRSVEVLRSFELRRIGQEPTIDLTSLQNKIIIIGIIGEGRSTFVQSPFTSEFPPMAIHATAIDNTLQDRFLVVANDTQTVLLALGLVLLSLLALFRLREERGVPVMLLIMILYVALSQVLFIFFSFVLPIVRPFIVLLGTAFVTILIEHRSMRNKMSILESQKASIESSLRERELRLQMLERELLDEKETNEPGRQSELVDEIRKYKQDIQRLSEQVADMVKYEAPTDEESDKAMEFEGIVYHGSGKMREVTALITKIAESDANVLILGESGTGKELVARAIHHRSKRNGRQFVAVNCGAIAETLLESELFGHERGAFTGAVKDKMGRFETADGGTVFLDEIAETSEAFQVKLLRILQEGEFERVGSSVTTKVNTRVLAASNKNIKELVEKKKFREDLYYRLNVLTVELPPLRERRSDSSLLVENFLRREDPALSVSKTVMDALLQYLWPGNVRELESAVKRASILAKSEKRSLIQLKDIPEAISASIRAQMDIEDQILESLRSRKFSRNSISETALELGGLNRGTVAEYFRGRCFRSFFENSWNRKTAAHDLAGSSEPEVLDRVEKKLQDYLTNVVERITMGQTFEYTKPKLKSKYKNLPQRYHSILDEVVCAYLQGKWS